MSDAKTALTLRRGKEWRNRLFLAPMTNKQSHDDGSLSDVEIEWLAARGRGGFGQVMTAAAFVSPEGRAWQGQLGVHDDAMLPGLARLGERIRATGARSSVQLHHGGLRADHRLNATPNRGPWASEQHHTTALSTGEVEALIEDTVQAALRVERAGLDGVQLHAAHGYLWGQFMDPRSNQRTDRFGGSLANRWRFTTETLQAIREATGPDFEVGVRLTPEGYGIPLSEAVEGIGAVLASGHVDTLDVSIWDAWMKPRKVDTGRLLIEEFLELPRHGTRLGMTGAVTDRAGVDWVLGHGPDALADGADFVGIGAAAILHHDAADRLLTDPGFRPAARPVSAEHLRAESVGEPFLAYLSTEWDDFVA